MFFFIFGVGGNFFFFSFNPSNFIFKVKVVWVFEKYFQF